MEELDFSIGQMYREKSKLYELIRQNKDLVQVKAK